jgi:hypothetical protein
MRIAAALALLAGCAARAPQQLPSVAVASLTPPPPPAPVEPPPAPPPPPGALTPEQLGDLCRVVAIDGEDGKPRPDLARVECDPPTGTPGPECLAGALFAASVGGVARNRQWFVYRISPAEQVAAGQFRIAVLYFETAEAYEKGRQDNADPNYVFTTAEAVLPTETFLMQRAQHPAMVQTRPHDDPFDGPAEGE